MDVKNITIVLYGLASLFMLWVFSLGAKSDFTLESFIVFSVLIYGGSSAFLGIQTLIGTPSNKYNQLPWFDFMVRMIVTTLIYGAAVTIILINRKLFSSNPWPSVISVIVVFTTNMYFVNSLYKGFSELDSA